MAFDWATAPPPSITTFDGRPNDSSTCRRVVGEDVQGALQDQPCAVPQSEVVGHFPSPRGIGGDVPRCRLRSGRENCGRFVHPGSQVEIGDGRGLVVDLADASSRYASSAASGANGPLNDTAVVLSSFVPPPEPDTTCIQRDVKSSGPANSG